MSRAVAELRCGGATWRATLNHDLLLAGALCALLLLGSACASTAPNPPGADASVVRTERTLEAGNKAVIHRYFDEIWNLDDKATIDEIVSPGYVHHPSAGPDGHGPDYVRLIVSTIRAAFPDIRFTVEEMVAEGDLVATRVTSTATHRGVWAGVEPTGRQIRGKEMLIHRVVDGKIVEGWSLPDRKGLIDQLQAP